MKALIKIAITGVVLALLFSAVDVHALLAHISDVPWYAIAYAALCYFIATYLGTLRWTMLLKAEGVILPFRHLLFYNLSYNFYSVVLPGGKVAAEAIRVYQIVRDTGDANVRGKVIFPTLLDRSMVVAVSALVAVLFFITAPVAVAFPWWLPYAGVLAVGAIMLTVFLPVERLFSFGNGLAIPKRSTLQSLRDALTKYRSRPALLLSTSVITLLMNVVIASGIYGITLSLHLPASYLLVFEVFSVGMVTAFLPLTIAGIGVREGVFAYVLTAASGAPIEATLSVSLLALLALLSVVVVGGVVEFYRHFIRHEKI